MPVDPAELAAALVTQASRDDEPRACVLVHLDEGYLDNDFSLNPTPPASPPSKDVEYGHRKEPTMVEQGLQYLSGFAWWRSFLLREHVASELPCPFAADATHSDSAPSCPRLVPHDKATAWTWPTMLTANPPQHQSVPSSPPPPPPPNTVLLPPNTSGHAVTLILDLDETMLHSSFKELRNPRADCRVRLDVDGTTVDVHVCKRPGLQEFLEEAAKCFEIVVFTASMSKYADPVIDAVDIKGLVQHRLFRESCVLSFGAFVKDLSLLGRDVQKCVIVDNSPAAYRLHRQNAVPVSSWFADRQDCELKQLIPYFKELSEAEDVKPCLRKIRSQLYSKPTSKAR